MTLRRFVSSSRDALRRIYPQGEADCIVGIVCRELLGEEAYSVYVEGEKPLDDASVRRALSAIERMGRHEPWQYVLGFADFYGRRFHVNPSVLIPRPETETLCSEALRCAARLARPVKVLDLCTGSGCIAWTVAAELGPLCGQVVGVDISSDALDVARGQEDAFPGLTAVPQFLAADIFDGDAVASILSRYGSFDLVLANPPYILRKEEGAMRRNVLDYEPHAALFVPDDFPMLFNEKIVEIFEKCSYADSSLLIEINESQSAGVQELIGSAGGLDERIVDDVFGRKRLVIVTKKTV